MMMWLAILNAFVCGASGAMALFEWHRGRFYAPSVFLACVTGLLAVIDVAAP